jgi:hypothetical protein
MQVYILDPAPSIGERPLEGGRARGRQRTRGGGGRERKAGSTPRPYPLRLCVREGFFQLVFAPVGIPTTPCAIRTQFALNDRPVTLRTVKADLDFAAFHR